MVLQGELTQIFLSGQVYSFKSELLFISRTLIYSKNSVYLLET